MHFLLFMLNVVSCFLGNMQTFLFLSVLDSVCLFAYQIVYLSVCLNIVVVCDVTVVAIGQGLLKKFWPMVNRLRSTHWREFHYLNYADPLTSLDLLNYTCTWTEALSRWRRGDHRRTRRSRGPTRPGCSAPHH